MKTATESNSFVYGSTFIFPCASDGYSADFTEETAFYSDETLYRSKTYCPLHYQDTDTPITGDVHLAQVLTLQILPMDENDRPLPFSLSVRAYYRNAAWTALCEVWIFGKPSRAYNSDTGVISDAGENFNFGARVSFTADPY